MKTFICSSRCSRFCNSPASQDILFSVSALYPGLTAAERAIASENPQKSLKAYQLSWTAESICKDEYLTSRTNDESDACRHFVWSALLTNKFGKSFAERVLNAHETEPTQSASEKVMDQSNNDRGIKFGEANPRLTSNDRAILLEGFRRELADGRIVVNKPREVKKP